MGAPIDIYSLTVLLIEIQVRGFQSFGKNGKNKNHPVKYFLVNAL
jgi:hypothetical protein